MFSTGSSVVDKLAAMNPWRPQEPPAENPQGPPDESSEEPAEKPPYQPTPVDIQVAWKMVTAATKFPSDIVDDILDHAEYWAHSSNYIDFQEEHQAQLRIAGTSKMENRFLVSSSRRRQSQLFVYTD